MGLMNAIGLQPRNPAPSVTSQGTQTPVVQLQNAETQTELSEPGATRPQAGTDISRLRGPRTLVFPLIRSPSRSFG